MADPLGGSPLSSLLHDPLLDLASNCVRDYFGPTVRTVSDCLLLRGESTVAQLLSSIRQQCGRVLNEERERLVDRLGPISESGNKPKINKARGPEQAGYVVDAAPVRAALIVLLQHSLVEASPPPPSRKDGDHDRGGGRGGGGGGGAGGSDSGGGKHAQYRYKFDPDRARLLPRYPKYVEHARKALDDGAAVIVEEICVHGRLRAEDCVRLGAEHVLRKSEEEDDDDDEEDEDEEEEGKSDEEKAVEARASIADALRRLVEGGYLERVKPIEEPDVGEPSEGSTGAEGGGGGANAAGGGAAGRKRKREEGGGKDADDDGGGDGAGGSEPGSAAAQEVAEDQLNRRDRDAGGPGVAPDPPEILSALRRVDPNRRLLPPGSVFRVNARMFHDSVRALVLGRLVAERYGDRVQSGGSMVTAALKLAARREHSPVSWTAGMDEARRRRAMEERTCFVPDDIMEYLPPAVLNNLKNKAGGARANLSTALAALAQFGWPQAVMEVEEVRGHPQGGKFEVATRQLVEHLRGRILHKAVLDSHGEVAARICSVLETKGHLESDAVAQAAMVPAKDVREILHNLFRANIVSLLNLQQTKQHNPSTAIYLWTVSRPRMFRTICDNVATALLNLRLRRQHQMELGKDWIERARDAAAEDENEHEEDKANYQRFCHGLERLDNAMLQLDETLTVLKEF